MSHTIEIAKTEIKDFDLLAKACERNGLPKPTRHGGSAHLYGIFPLGDGRQTHQIGFSIDLASGRITGDADYRSLLDQAVAAIVPHYGAEMAIAEAEANGFAWQFAEAPSGEVELVIEAF